MVLAESMASHVPSLEDAAEPAEEPALLEPEPPHAASVRDDAARPVRARKLLLLSVEPSNFLLLA